MIEFRILGPIEIYVNDRIISPGYAKQRCVLAALLLDFGRLVPVDRMVHRLWGEEAPASARSVLYGHVARLRRVLQDAGAVRPCAAIASQPGGYLLTVEPEALDLYRFRQLTRQAGESTPDCSIRLLRDALALWRGPALAGTSGVWAERAREALDCERLAAQLDLHDRLLNQGATTQLVVDLSELAVRYPLHEGIVRRLMLALYRSDLTAEALDCYSRVRRHLIDALGTDPGAELENLHRRILRRDPALLIS